MPNYQGLVKFDYREDLKFFGESFQVPNSSISQGQNCLDYINVLDYQPHARLHDNLELIGNYSSHSFFLIQYENLTLFYMGGVKSTPPG